MVNWRGIEFKLRTNVPVTHTLTLRATVQFRMQQLDRGEYAKGT